MAIFTFTMTFHSLIHCDFNVIKRRLQCFTTALPHCVIRHISAAVHHCVPCALVYVSRSCHIALPDNEVGSVSVMRAETCPCDWCAGCKQHPSRIRLSWSVPYYTADSRFAHSQWETALQCNDVSHLLGASLESALISYSIWNISVRHTTIFIFQK